MKETVLDIYTAINNFFNPLREWPLGEDGKYIHFLLGIFTTLGVFSVLNNPINFVGLVLFGLAVGIAIERAQKLFGGTNTFKEAALDAMWVWLGSMYVSYALLMNEYIVLYYGA